MMKICDDLKSIYRDTYFCEYQDGDTIEILEERGDPDVTGVSINVKSELTNIQSDFLHNSTSSYYKRNTCKPEIQHDCDGIMLLHYKNDDFLVLLELKSHFTKTNIEKAEKQIAASLFRMICRLKPLNSFDVHNCKVCGIIVSLPVSDETKRDIRVRKNAGKKLKRFEEQAYHFLRKSQPYLLEDEHIGLSKLPVNPVYIKKQIPLFHIDVKKGFSEIDIYNRLIKLQ